MKRKTMLIVIACGIALLVSAVLLIACGGNCGISSGDRVNCGGGGHIGIIVLITCVIILLSWIFYFKPRKKQK